MAWMGDTPPGSSTCAVPTYLTNVDSSTEVDRLISLGWRVELDCSQLDGTCLVIRYVRTYRVVGPQEWLILFRSR